MLRALAAEREGQLALDFQPARVERPPARVVSLPPAVRIQSPKLSRSLVLARRRDRYFSAAGQEFMRVLRAAAQRVDLVRDDW